MRWAGRGFSLATMWNLFRGCNVRWTLPLNLTRFGVASAMEWGSTITRGAGLESSHWHGVHCNLFLLPGMPTTQRNFVLPLVQTKFAAARPRSKTWPQPSCAPVFGHQGPQNWVLLTVSCSVFMFDTNRRGSRAERVLCVHFPRLATLPVQASATCIQVSYIPSLP